MADVKKSQYTTVSTVSDDRYFNIFGQNTDEKISKPDLFNQIQAELYSPFIYPTVELLQAADLEADEDFPTYVRVEENQYKLYKITSLAAGVDDITLNNGATATFQVEYRDIGFVVGPESSVSGALAVFSDTSGTQLDDLVVPTATGRALITASETATKGYFSKDTDNTVDVLQAQPFFDEIKQSAASGYAGAIKKSTTASVITGTADDEAVTPLTLQALTATETRDGLIEIATRTEAIDGNDQFRAMTPYTTSEVLKARATTVVETFADLATTPAPTAGMVVYLKQHTSGGVGGGYFQDTAGTITNNGGTLINNTLTAGRHWKRINYSSLTVEMFGAGTTSDDATAFNLAIASLGGNGGTITGEKLSYTIRSQINLNANYTFITMKKGTFFNVVPVADIVVFKIEQSTGSTVLFGGSIENIIFSSSDTTYKKTAIKLIDTSGFVLRGIRSHSPHWYGAGSIGLHLLGRELCSIYDTYFFAARAVVLSPIPAPHVASGIGNDQINFHNAYLLSVGNPVVEIENGTSVTNLNFTGYQSWIGGTYGLYWVDTTSSDVSFDVNLSNIRWEQPDNATGYAVYISHTQGVRTLRVLNCYASERNGIYCRNVDFIKLDGYSFATVSKESLNVDSTCQELSIANTFTQTGSTATLGGQQLIYASSKVTTGSPLPTNATYSSTSLASYEFSVGATLTGEVLTLADTQIVKIGNTDTLEELKIAYYPIGVMATFELNGTNHTVNEVRDAGGFFSNVAGTASSINIYWSAANSQYEIQNLRGAEARLRIVRSGGRIFW